MIDPETRKEEKMRDVLMRIVRERSLGHDRAATLTILGGAAILGVVLAVGAWLGLQTGAYYSGGLDATSRVHIGQVLATEPMWLTPLALAALSGFMVSVAVLLRRITRTITLRRDALVTIGRTYDR
jgi:hypothetical protein